jgi:hypothetical protein
VSGEKDGRDQQRNGDPEEIHAASRQRTSSKGFYKAAGWPKFPHGVDLWCYERGRIMHAIDDAAQSCRHCRVAKFWGWKALPLNLEVPPGRHAGRGQAASGGGEKAEKASKLAALIHSKRKN